jgi:hypothetical protein
VLYVTLSDVDTKVYNKYILTSMSTHALAQIDTRTRTRTC